MPRTRVVIAPPFEDRLIEELRRQIPDMEFVKAEDQVRREIQLLRRDPGSAGQRQATAELDAILGDAEVMLCGFRMPENVPARMPRLRWVHSMAAGVERYLESGLFEAGATLTNARGVAATPIAEWVLGAMIMFAKGIPTYFLHKQRRFYQPRGQIRLPFSLEGKTLAVIGLGAIGSETARLAKALGMRVVATKRHVEGPPPPHVDRLYGPDQTREALGEARFVAVALPLIESTRRAIGEAELRAMREDAYIMNVGRGPLIDEAALARALREGWIAGAALDVFEKEPLPEDSPLWEMENVIFSPHVSGEVDDYDDRVMRLFAENLRRYRAGEPLLNVVDPGRGY